MDFPGILLLGGFFILYFVPSMVAAWSGHRQFPAIFVLNIFLGWTLLGWVAALAWALTVTGERAA